MKKILSITIIFLTFVAISTHAQNNAPHKKFSPYKAIIHHPVIDMNCTPSHTNYLCISPGFNKNCNRSHQGLYNEIVTCIEEKNEFVKIILPTIKYKTDNTPSSFWTKKTNIIPLQKIKHHKITRSIPNPTYGKKPTIVLTYPWKNFSVGTRFKHIIDNDTVYFYGIVRAHYTKNKLIYDSIPHTHAIQEIQQNPQSTRQLFVHIISNLIDKINAMNSQQIIPYVWGGSSFIYTYTDEKFHQKQNGAWYRSEHHNVHTGYDCSELVMRMAQIAGLNFPWKTTDTIQKSQRKLTRNEKLENGDLIWFKGHIMIISNIALNEVIEARGYPSGHGCIHKIKLYELFENIKNYNDLLHYYYTNKSLLLKNKDGEFLKKIDSFQILKLIN